MDWLTERGVNLSIIAGSYAALLLLEQWFPLRATTAKLLRRLATNVLITLLAFATSAVVLRPILMNWLGLQTTTPQGLLSLLPTISVLRWGVAFLLLDLSFYYWHRLNHRVPWLWRFHNVHHIDPDLDVSTAFRFHFGEIALSLGLRAVQVVGIGLTLPMFLAYELTMTLCTLFHHSNVRLPLRLERVLNCLVVTPRMHGIHHSQQKSEANSNYGVVFPWWDWLHRTTNLSRQQSEIHIGVPAYTRPEDNRCRRLLVLPFRHQRDDWTPPIPRDSSTGQSAEIHPLQPIPNGAAASSTRRSPSS